MTKPLGLVLAGGLARRMGGGDKARIRVGGATILERVLARMKPQCTEPDPQCQRRSGTLRRQRPHRGAGFGAGLRRTARRHPGRARLGGREPAGDRRCGERAGRLPVPAARSGGALERNARRRRQAARLRALGRLAPSGGRAMAGQIARRPAPRPGGGGPAQDRDLDRPARHRGRGLAGAPVDPFFNVNTPEDAAAAEQMAALEIS